MADYFGNRYWTARYFDAGYWGIAEAPPAGAMSASLSGAGAVSATLTSTTVSTSTSAGSYNMYRPADWGKKKLRKIKYVGPANERLAFYVEKTPANGWIPSTVYSPSVLDALESNGLIVRQIINAKHRAMMLADEEWLMLG